MVYPRATELIPCDAQSDIENKWSDLVDGGNGCLYGIPSNARHVLQLNIEDKSIKEIGPDLGAYKNKYKIGVKAGNGSIYCLPDRTNYSIRSCPHDHILKITPMEGQDAKVVILKDKYLPESYYNHTWREGALAKDGCIYYFPSDGERVLRLDPNCDDQLLLVGKEYVGKYFTAAIAANNGCIYCISPHQVIKFNSSDYCISVVGGSLHSRFEGGVLADDGHIYSINQHGQILKIDTTNNDWTIIGCKIFSGYRGWGRPVLGADKCIYFPPLCHDQVFKFNPRTHNISLIGDFFGDEFCKWNGTSAASDGYIYCIPCNAGDILQIDSRHMNEQILELFGTINA